MLLGNLKAFDRLWSARLQTWSRGDLQRKAFAAIAHSADSLVAIPALVLLWFVNADRFINISLSCAYALSIVLSMGLKYAVRRQRPIGDWGKFYRRADPFSFPSGHAARTVALTVVLFATVSAGAGAAGLAWAVLVCLSRIALGIHYVSDIAAGALVGISTGVVVWLVVPALGIMP